MANLNRKTQKVQLTNCRVLRNHKITKDDLWWRLPGVGGRATIINPQSNFWSAQHTHDTVADYTFDCKGLIVAPGYIDLQINGAFGVDFTHLKEEKECEFGGFKAFSQQILKHGCTSFCPTLITSSPQDYRVSLANINSATNELKNKSRERSLKLEPFWNEGFASSLGMHLEGPFISNKGAHPADLIKTPYSGIDSVEEAYGPLDGVAVVTMAPEIDGAHASIASLTRMGIVVSMGHSKARIQEGIQGINKGGRFITHLFNAMEPFHHRDPGLVGLLGVSDILDRFFYGLIADGIHVHPASIKIAASAHPSGLVLVTDAMAAMGLSVGRYTLGDVKVDISADMRAVVSGTDTLAGAVATIDECVRNFKEFTRCSNVEAIEAATLHPARCLRIEDRKGSLAFGRDADVILLDDELNVKGAFVNGRLVWMEKGCLTHKRSLPSAL